MLTGFVNQLRIPEYYAAGDLLVMPSEYESYGVVVLEGAVFGHPVVISDVVGCVGPSDAAQHGVNAIVYPSGDRKRFFEAIEAIRGDPELYARMSNASLEIAKDRDLGQAGKAIVAVAEELRDLGPRA